LGPAVPLPPPPPSCMARQGRCFFSPSSRKTNRCESGAKPWPLCGPLGFLHPLPGPYSAVALHASPNRFRSNPSARSSQVIGTLFSPEAPTCPMRGLASRAPRTSHPLSTSNTKMGFLMWTGFFRAPPGTQRLPCLTGGRVPSPLHHTCCPNWWANWCHPAAGFLRPHAGAPGGTFLNNNPFRARSPGTWPNPPVRHLRNDTQSVVPLVFFPLSGPLVPVWASSHVALVPLLRRTLLCCRRRRLIPGRAPNGYRHPARQTDANPLCSFPAGAPCFWALRFCPTALQLFSDFPPFCLDALGRSVCRPQTTKSGCAPFPF